MPIETINYYYIGVSLFVFILVFYIIHNSFNKNHTIDIAFSEKNNIKILTAKGIKWIDPNKLLIKATKFKDIIIILLQKDIVYDYEKFNNYSTDILSNLYTFIKPYSKPTDSSSFVTIVKKLKKGYNMEYLNPHSEQFDNKSIKFVLLELLYCIVKIIDIIINKEHTIVEVQDNTSKNYLDIFSLDILIFGLSNYIYNSQDDVMEVLNKNLSDGDIIITNDAGLHRKKINVSHNHTKACKESMNDYIDGDLLPNNNTLYHAKHTDHNASALSHDSMEDFDEIVQQSAKPKNLKLSRETLHKYDEYQPTKSSIM